MSAGVTDRETRTEFTIRMTDERVSSTGVSRDTTEGKINYALVYDGPMLKRWAEHLTKGAKLHGARNWTKASTQEDFERFREGAARHFAQVMEGLTDEDHMAAVYFNLNGMALAQERIRAMKPEPWENKP